MPVVSFDYIAQHEAMAEEITRLRAALERHVCDCKSNCAWERDETCPSWDARAALAQKNSDDQ